MANDLAKNPLVLDTVGAVLANKMVSVYSVQWVTPTTVGHSGILKDQNGNTIFEATCVVANQSLIKYFKPGFSFVGLNVDTLGSGKFHVMFNQIGDAGTRIVPFRD